MLGVIQSADDLPLMHTVHPGNVRETKALQGMLQKSLPAFKKQSKRNKKRKIVRPVNYPGQVIWMSRPSSGRTSEILPSKTISLAFPHGDD